MKNRNLKNHNNWGTPAYFYNKLNREFNFDFDPCPLCEEGKKLPFDGLSISWGKRNFINPPYSRKLKEAFINKALVESKKGKLCVLLLPVSTSTKIYHEVILPNVKEIRFVRGRISFCGYNTKGEWSEKGRGMHDSMIVIFGKR